MFAFSTIGIAAALSSVGVYAAPPTVARSTCSPNTQGNAGGIVLVDSGVQWGAANFTPASGEVLSAVSFLGTPVPEPNFLIAQSGQIPTSFTITTSDGISSTGLVVTAINNQLFFEPPSTGNQESQLFDIACQSCSATPSPPPLGQPAGTSCTISPQGDSSTCVGVQDDSSLLITECDGSDSQLYTIVL